MEDARVRATSYSVGLKSHAGGSSVVNSAITKTWWVDSLKYQTEIVTGRKKSRPDHLFTGTRNSPGVFREEASSVLSLVRGVGWFASVYTRAVKPLRVARWSRSGVSGNATNYRIVSEGEMLITLRGLERGRELSGTAPATARQVTRERRQTKFGDVCRWGRVATTVVSNNLRVVDLVWLSLVFLHGEIVEKKSDPNENCRGMKIKVSRWFSQKSYFRRHTAGPKQNQTVINLNYRVGEKKEIHENSFKSCAKKKTLSVDESAF